MVSYETSVILQYFFKVKNAKNALTLDCHCFLMTSALPRHLNNISNLLNVSQLHHSKEESFKYRSPS